MALYTAVALFMLYPAWTDPAHGVVADWSHPDAIGNHWLYQWVPERLLAGESLLHNERYYWPVGDAPFLAGNGSDAVPFTALAAWVDWPFSVTLWCLVLVVLNGVAGMVVAETVGVTGGAAVLTGAFLVFSPYVGRELSAGRFAQAGLFLSAFFLASWLRHLERPSWGRGALAAALYAAAAFQYWYYGLWLALAGAILWLGRPALAPLVRFVPPALALTAPPLAMFLANWSAIPGADEAVFPHPISIDYALPATFPVWSGTGPLSSVGLPISLSVLALLGLRGADPRVRGPVLAAAAVFYALCLGPELLAVDGETLGVPAPFQLVYAATASLRRFWWPYRHIAPLTIVLLPLAARGAERLLAWLNVPLAVGVALILLPLELYARGAVVEVSASWWAPPPAYTALAALPEGNVLELPIYERLARHESPLSYQFAHRKPLVTGHAMWVDRVRPPAWDEWVRTQPLLDALRRFEAGELSGSWTMPEGVAPWDAGAVRYVTVSREYFPTSLEALRKAHVAFLTEWYGPPVVKSGGVMIWDVGEPPRARAHVFPVWTPPQTYVNASALGAAPDIVHARGWMNWPRSFPPTEPERSSPATEREARLSHLPPLVRRKIERELPDTGGALDAPTDDAAP